MTTSNELKAGHYLSFRVAGQWYGVHVASIIEVLNLVELDDLPAAPVGMIGLLTLRDEILPVIDLQKHFVDAPARLRLDTPIIALRLVGGAVGLLVDEIDDVIEVKQAVTPRDLTSPYIVGVVKLPGRNLFLLDPEVIYNAVRLTL